MDREVTLRTGQKASLTRVMEVTTSLNRLARTDYETFRQLALAVADPDCPIEVDRAVLASAYDLTEDDAVKIVAAATEYAGGSWKIVPCLDYEATELSR